MIAVNRTLPCMPAVRASDGYTGSTFRVKFACWSPPWTRTRRGGFLSTTFPAVAEPELGAEANGGGALVRVEVDLDVKKAVRSKSRYRHRSATCNGDEALD